MSPQTDEFIKQDIIDHLVWDDSIDANDIHVSVNDGVVELTGTVPGYTTKLAAEEDARQVKGVIDVDNSLEIVFPPQTSRPSDAAITSNIENKLLWNSSINAANITV
ncbi:MAG: BON domain-containing protein, partial [Bacteroidota bacterium]